MATVMMHEVIETADGQQVILEYPPGGREAAIAQAEQQQQQQQTNGLHLRVTYQNESFFHIPFPVSTIAEYYVKWDKAHVTLTDGSTHVIEPESSASDDMQAFKRPETVEEVDMVDMMKDEV